MSHIRDTIKIITRFISLCTSQTHCNSEIIYDNQILSTWFEWALKANHMGRYGFVQKLSLTECGMQKLTAILLKYINWFLVQCSRHLLFYFQFYYIWSLITHYTRFSNFLKIYDQLSNLIYSPYSYACVWVFVSILKSLSTRLKLIIFLQNNYKIKKYSGHVTSLYMMYSEWLL